MALSGTASAGLGGLPYDQSPQTYTTLGDLLEGNKDEVRDIYASIYGDQGLSGLVEVIGAKKNAAGADHVTWFEEGRLGRKVTIAADNTITHIDGVANDDETDALRKYDVIMKADQVLVVTDVVADEVTAYDMADGSDETAISTGDWFVVGNAHPQGTAQPTSPFQPRITKRENPFIIVKESFHVTGSQASNIGWVNVGGQNMWYLKGELDARRKFLNMREAMLVFGQKNATSAGAFGGSVTGSEGYVEAVESRGTVSNTLSSATDLTGFDTLLVALDAQGLPAENALYLNKAYNLKMDTLLGAAGMDTSNGGIGAMNAFGAFNNDRDMALNMGFQSFTRGGYTFHKHDWKLLNDPLYGGGTTMKGAIIPLSIITDAKTGNRHHSLEMNYKSAGNYSRELEHWVEGGGVLGYNTGGDDVAKFNYRSECNLCVRGANQHAILT